MAKTFTLGNSPTSMQNMFEANIVIMQNQNLDKVGKLHVAKNRTGTIGAQDYSVAIGSMFMNKSMDETIDILSEVIARKTFGGFTKIFEEGMKQEIIEAVKKIVNRE